MACGERPGGLGALRVPSCRFRLEGGREEGAPRLPSPLPKSGVLFGEPVFYIFHLADRQRRPTKSKMNQILMEGH